MYEKPMHVHMAICISLVEEVMILVSNYDRFILWGKGEEKNVCQMIDAKLASFAKCVM